MSDKLLSHIGIFEFLLGSLLLSLVTLVRSKKEFFTDQVLAELALRLAELALRLGSVPGCIHPLHHPSKGLEGTPDGHMRVHSCVFCHQFRPKSCLPITPN